MMKNFNLLDTIGEMIYGIRWGLVPMYVGLWVAIIAYNVQFYKELVEFIFVVNDSGIHFRENDSTHYLLWVLGMIDITMIANLIVMITVGGYSTFIKEFDLKSLKGRPRWMNGLDSNTLKNKMGMSLVGVSAIRLLQTFMEAGTTDWNQVNKQILMHLVFIITTLAFAFNAKLMHGHTPKPAEEHVAQTEQQEEQHRA